MSESLDGSSGDGHVRQQCCCRCWAIVAAEVVESCYNVLNQNATVACAPQELIDFVPINPNMINPHGCCYPATLRKALDYIKEHGISLEKNYPFQGRRRAITNIEDRPTQNKIKIGGFASLGRGETINSRIIRHPLAASIYLTNEFMDKNKVDIYKVGSDDAVTLCSSQMIDGPLSHVVLVIGYGTDHEGNTFWTIRNSFGEGWGENGHKRICSRSRFLGKPLLFDVVFPLDPVMHSRVN